MDSDLTVTLNLMELPDHWYYQQVMFVCGIFVLYGMCVSAEWVAKCEYVETTRSHDKCWGLINIDVFLIHSVRHSTIMKMRVFFIY